MWPLLTATGAIAIAVRWLIRCGDSPHTALTHSSSCMTHEGSRTVATSAAGLFIYLRSVTATHDKGSGAAGTAGATGDPAEPPPPTMPISGCSGSGASTEAYGERETLCGEAVSPAALR